MLKLATDKLAPALTNIFQQSYDLSSTPKNWNSAIATPIFKKGFKSDPSNYGPISLACICCKIMVHIMLSHIAKHIAKNNILINEQHGLRNKLSIFTHLIFFKALNKYLLSLVRTLYIHCIYIVLHCIYKHEKDIYVVYA